MMPLAASAEAAGAAGAGANALAAAEDGGSALLLPSPSAPTTFHCSEEELLRCACCGAAGAEFRPEDRSVPPAVLDDDDAVEARFCRLAASCAVTLTPPLWEWV